MIHLNRKHWVAGLPAFCLLVSSCTTGALSPPSENRLPVLALVVAQKAGADISENIEDLLVAELGSEPNLKMVDRSLLKRILKEHALSLSGLTDKKNAVSVGKFTGADFLLFVEVLIEKAAIRLVEVPSGKVLLEEKVAFRKDIPLTVAAIRQKTLKALRLEPDVKDRLTVGITAFPNRSGTDRSDKLGIELQKSIRKRLRAESWATVLERQYPSGLLDEVELTRLGLAKGPTGNLPPADVVITGIMEDVTRQYNTRKPWKVKIDLTIRLRKKTTHFGRIWRSDSVGTVTEEIVKEINAFRRKETTGKPAESEKQLWRRHGLYLMPRARRTVGREVHDCLSKRQKLDTREAIRAWENLLLLDADNSEARLNLGVCLVSLYLWQLRTDRGVNRQLATAHCLRGSYLVESAARVNPNPHNTATFHYIAGGMTERLPKRSAEMFDYITSHPKNFPAWSTKYARIGLARLRKERVFTELDRAVRNVREDPRSLCTLTIQLVNNYVDLPDPAIAFAAKYLNSPDPLVRFLFEYATAELLWRKKKAPSALDHFDRAIRAQEGAYASCKPIDRLLVDDIYRFKIAACRTLEKPKEARKTALDGARHFMKIGRFNFPISWLYFHCVTEVLKDDEQKETLAICDAYLAASERHKGVQNNYGARITEIRERLKASLSGIHLPTFDKMHLVAGTDTNNLYAPRMAVAGGKLWIVWQRWQSGGPAMVYVPGDKSAGKLSGLPRTMRSVAVVGDKVFFGGKGGLYQLDTKGKIRKHYSKRNNQIPSNHIVDLREGGGRIYMSFVEADRYGVAVFDPATDVVTVLAPTGRKAGSGTEPVTMIYRLWWDSVHSHLYANDFLLCGSERGHQRLGWMQSGKGWRRGAFPRYIISEGKEALQMTIKGKQTVFEFLKTGQKIKSRLPLPGLIGEPAWDEKRIWVPAYTGLYEIERATGKAKWLAHRQGTQCLAVLKYLEKLYVATTRGLYYCDIPNARGSDE